MRGSRNARRLSGALGLLAALALVLVNRLHRLTVDPDRSSIEDSVRMLGVNDLAFLAPGDSTNPSRSLTLAINHIDDTRMAKKINRIVMAINTVRYDFSCEALVTETKKRK